MRPGGGLQCGQVDVEGGEARLAPPFDHDRRQPLGGGLHNPHEGLDVAGGGVGRGHGVAHHAGGAAGDEPARATQDAPQLLASGDQGVEGQGAPGGQVVVRERRHRAQVAGLAGGVDQEGHHGDPAHPVGEHVVELDDDRGSPAVEAFYHGEAPQRAVPVEPRDGRLAGVLEDGVQRPGLGRRDPAHVVREVEVAIDHPPRIGQAERRAHQPVAIAGHAAAHPLHAPSTAARSGTPSSTMTAVIVVRSCGSFSIHYASYNGTARVEFSSGGRVVHRLSQRGNRQLNHAIHMAAVCQIRQPHSDGRAYFDRKLAEGKTKKEALRSLKRQVSNTIYRQFILDTERQEA